LIFFRRPALALLGQEPAQVSGRLRTASSTRP
jgi:hypothetical protein